MDTPEREERRARHLLAPWLCLLCLLSAPVPTPAAERSDLDDRGLQISSDLRVQVQRGREIELLVLAAESDDYDSIAFRVSGSANLSEAISAWNAGRSVDAGVWIRVPILLLSFEYRALVLRSLFPADAHDGANWIHSAQSGALPTYDEGLWEVAEWFTGRGENYRELMRVNGLSSPELRSKQPVRIPANLLHSAFRPGMRSENGELEYGSDERGPFAGYRLKAGEALYSAVVGRFTGRTGADDVREVALQLQERSGIRDLRDIPVGYLIKIPFDLLEPQFLPVGHPRRNEAEAAEQALAQSLASAPVEPSREGLEDVLIVLDAGHGGRDLGTINNGIWEHDYVYDVTCRLRRLLEQQTSADVRMTVMDVQTGCEPSKTDKLNANRQGTVLTDPPFLAKENGEAKIGVNLRWYLANSIYRDAMKRGVSRDRVVFISLHADSRHPSLRGVMVYVPGEAYRSRTYGSNSKTYRKFKEVREKPTVHFSKKERVRSEAVSTEFAKNIVDAYGDAGLPIQPYQPVRNRIIRGKSIWVPAVLRGNMIPNKVLVEMVNLSNSEDAAILASARQRQRLADALFRSIMDYFGEE